MDSIFNVIASVASAEVITLECNGTNSEGKDETVAIQYDERRGWVNDNGIMASWHHGNNNRLSPMRHEK